MKNSTRAFVEIGLVILDTIIVKFDNFRSPNYFCNYHQKLWFKLEIIIEKLGFWLSQVEHLYKHVRWFYLHFCVFRYKYQCTQLVRMCIQKNRKLDMKIGTKRFRSNQERGLITKLKGKSWKTKIKKNTLWWCCVKLLSIKYLVAIKKGIKKQ